jgi:hypothetical protein
MRLRRAVLSLALCASLASSVLANTYIVDANGGGQFTDIQTAISAAQDGDVILVHPGQYASFTLDKGLVIVGYGGVDTLGTTQIVNVGSGQRAAVVNLQSQSHDGRGTRRGFSFRRRPRLGLPREPVA